MLITLLQSAGRSINNRFTRQLVADDAALTVLFRMFNDAEENAEARVFTDVAQHVDGRLARIVRIHAADEDKHVELTQHAPDLLGNDPNLVDTRADMVDVIDTHLGGVLNTSGTREDLGRAYLLMYALERRMCAQLTQLIPALQARYPELAAIAEEMLDDELKHIGWCCKVAWNLLDEDQDQFDAIMAEMVELEAKVFAQVTHQNLNALLDAGLTQMHPLERGFWRGFAHALKYAPSLPVPDPTGVIAARTWSPAKRRGVRMAA